MSQSPITHIQLQPERAKKINMAIPLEGKRVLEIGCGSGEMLKILAEQYEVDHIIGVDLNVNKRWKGDKQGSNWSVQDANVEQLPFADNGFDAVISIATFEHIHNTSKALSEIKRVLKPFGRFYTEIGGIWTSVVGHHYAGPSVNWQEVSLMPPWGHLYLTEDEMRKALREQTSDESLIQDMVQSIYLSDNINRHSRTHLVNVFMNCGMLVKEYREIHAFNRRVYSQLPGTVKLDSELTDEIIERVKSAGYDPRDIGVAGMVVNLEKYACLP